MHIYYTLLHSLEDLKFSEEAMRQFRIQFISLLFIYRPNTFKLNATKTRQKFSENQIFKRNKSTWSDTFRYLQYEIARLAFSTIYQHCFHCLKKSPQRFSSSPSLYLLFSPFYIKGKAKTKPKSCHHFSSAVVKAKMERGSYWSILSWPGSPHLCQKDDPACAQNRYYVTVFLHNMIKQDFIWVICHSVPDSFGARGNRREGWEPTWKLSSWKFRPFYFESCHLCVLLPTHLTFLI